jgi:hypothetical protein
MNSAALLTTLLIVGLAAAIIDATQSGWHRMSCWIQVHDDATVIIAGGAWGVPIVVEHAQETATSADRHAHLPDGTDREVPTPGPVEDELAMLENLWLL